MQTLLDDRLDAYSHNHHDLTLPDITMITKCDRNSLIKTQNFH